MGIYGHRFDNYRSDLHPEIVQEGIVDAFKSIIESIKKGIVNLIDKINGWLDKHPDSKVAQGLKSILTKLKNLLTKADKIKSKEDAEEVKNEVDKNKEEAEDLMKDSENGKILKVFIDGIKNNDLDSLREGLGNLIYTSSDFSSGEFDKTLKYIKTKGIDIMEDLKGDLILKNKSLSEYNEDELDDLLADAVFELKRNFCQERIDEIKKIGKFLNNK